MKVLFIGCHCDDIELGCGGIIRKFSQDWNIHCLTLSQSYSVVFDEEKSRRLSGLKETSEKATAYLGAAEANHMNFPVGFFSDHRQEIWKTLNAQSGYDLVFTQFGDEHQDHSTLYNESIRNFRTTSLLAYSITRSCFDFHPTAFYPLSREDLDAKLKALSYYSSMYDDKNYFDPKNVEAEARMRGIYIQEEFAEAFFPLRTIVR